MLQKRPVFICGMSRSGTSWLADSLAQSTEIVYLHEAWLLRQLHDLSLWQDTLYRDWSEFTPWSKFNLDKKKFCSHMGRFYEGLLLDMSNGQRFLEKTPIWNVLFVDTLQQMFEDAFFIFIYRDGRNCVASLEAKKITENKAFDFKVMCQRWAESMDIIARQTSTNPPCNVHSVRYEDLLKNFNLEFEEICHHIEIQPFSVKPVKANSSFDETTTTDDFNNRWLAWSDDKTNLFHEIAGKQLKDWGYL